MTLANSALIDPPAYLLFPLSNPHILVHARQLVALLLSFLFFFFYLLKTYLPYSVGESSTKIEFKVFFSLFSVDIILSPPNIGFSGEMRHREGNMSREKRKKNDY